MKNNLIAPKADIVNSRQIALAGACLLPAARLLEAPSILAKYAAGDLLLPAILHFLLQGGLLFALLFACSRSEKTLFERLEIQFGKWSALVYIALSVYYLFSAILPLFDLEKFTYAVFFDTAPTSFSFLFFFLFSAFMCVKSLKTLSRTADICLFLYLIPFILLLAMGCFAADFTRLLPLFGNEFGDTMYALKYSTPHFSDTLLLLPLLGNLRYKKGDTVKILAGYSAGALGSLFFFATFFSIFSSIAPREHYAFAKIAQYFPALDIVGRFDLLFVYMLTIVLFYYTAMPLQFTTNLFCQAIGTRRTALVSTTLNGGLLVFLLFCNKFYNTVYTVISGKLSFLFWVCAGVFTLLFSLLPDLKKKEKKDA